MSPRYIYIIGIILIVAILPNSVTAQKSDWVVEYNETYECEFEYPEQLFNVDVVYEDDRGIKLTSKDGEAVINFYCYETFQDSTITLQPIEIEYQKDTTILEEHEAYIFYCELIAPTSPNDWSQYIIQGFDNGTFIFKRTICRDNIIASISTNYSSISKSLYGKYAEDIIMSLQFIKIKEWEEDSFSEAIGSVWMKDTIQLLTQKENPLITDFFYAFARQYPIISLFQEEGFIYDTNIYNSDHFNTLTIDTTNNYIFMELSNKENHWIEATSKQIDDKTLILISINDPYQIIFYYEYDKKRNTIKPSVNIDNLAYDPEYIARLPREGFKIMLFNQSDTTKPAAYIEWDGMTFQYNDY